MEKNLTQRDYESLAEFRHQIRRFLRFSERAAREAGLEPRQHQLLLALKGLPPNVRPKIAELAERLQIQHHSAVELVNRLDAERLLELLERCLEGDMHIDRRVQLVLTLEGLVDALGQKLRAQEVRPRA